MTIITVCYPKGRLDVDARKLLATTLTDAVLEPELGQMFEPARIGFQVWFNEFDRDRVAIGGRLLSDREIDVIAIDVAVMDGDWPVELRGSVIGRLLRALADGLGREQPVSTWWGNVPNDRRGKLGIARRPSIDPLSARLQRVLN